MNKRFLSTLLTGAIFLAATSMFVSCKDYDDDIKNLQAQIDKAALKSEVDALQATLSQVSSTASSALSKAEQGLKDAAAAQAAADKAQKAADDAAAQAAKAISDAAKAQSAADAAQAFAETVKTTADAALALGQAAATKDDLDAAKKELKKLADDAQATADAALTLAKAAATQADFDKAVADFTEAVKKAQATADAAATKADFDKAVAELTEAAAAAQAAADAAQASADAAQASADQVASDLADAKEELKDFAKAAAKEAKEAAITEAVALAKTYADELAANEAEAVKEELKKYATNTALKTLADEINNELEELKDAIAQTATEAAFEILSDDVKKYAGQIDVLFAAVTSVELFASISYNDWGIDWRNIHSQAEYMAARAANLATYQSSLMGFLDMYDGGPIMTQIFYGSVKENSVFGDEAYQDADKLIEYKKGADIKDEATLLVRVNPVNADLSAADMKLINSKGEDLSDVIVVAGAERFNEYLYAETTRGNDINSGLWKVTLKAADGLTPEAWAKAVTNLTDEQIAAMAAGEEPEITSPVGIKKFALAINNTQSDNADRYVASTFDLLPIYAEYMPAPAFTFSVNDIPVNYVRNRWTFGREDELYILPEQQYTQYYDNPELAWNPQLWGAEENAIPATEPTAVDADDANVIIDGNVWYRETRRNEQFIYADVNEEFTISNVAGWYYMEGQGQLFSEYYLGQQIDYYYVVFDKDNAIESKPSEWNAWKSYTVEGLGVMTKATESLTMKITSEDAHGDVVGFRVYAVNRDGTLADPDGRAFYVYVGSKDDEFKTASANVIADKLDAVSEEMDVTGWFKKTAYYYFTPDVYSTTPGQYEWSNDNPEWVDYDEVDYLGEFSMRSGFLTFYDADGEVIYQTGSGYGWSISGYRIADAVKVTFTPKQDVSYMLDGETYVINIYRTQEEAPSDNVESYFGTLSITKVMPTTAKPVEFRPKQEGDWKDGVWATKDGTGKFMAYMIPNTNEWSAPWATQFEGSYELGDDDRDNGFKDLNNIFYNLNEDTDFEFVFATSLADGDDVVDLTDEDGNGLSYNYPAGLDMNYVLDVATPFIDGKTEHAVTVYTNYQGVSTYIDEDGDVQIGKTWKVAGDQTLTAIYACWHHAMHDIAWDKAVSLQWSAEGGSVEKAFGNITTKNRYNSTYFGLTIAKLIENNWIAYVDDSAELNTKADGTGQVNPYFKPTVENGKITFDQTSVQVDANPTADHTEYLILTFKDAFGHEFEVSTEVKILKAKSNAPAL